MRSLKPILIIFILIPILVVGGIKGYMHYKLKEKMDVLVKQSRFFGDLKYDSLSTSLTGKLGVHGIRLRFHGLDDIIHIEAVEYTPPNLWFMLQDANKLERGELPEKMKLSVTGLSLDLYGDLTDRIDETVDRINAEMSGTSRLCGDRMFFTPHDYREMGYEDITIDASIGYWYDEMNDEVIVEIDKLWRNMGEINVNMAVTGIDDTRLDRLMHSKEPPRIARMDFSYTDKSYVSRFTKMCANESQLTREEYIEEEARQKPAYFANTWGIAPGPGLREAYKKFLKKPGSINVSLELPESVEYDKIDLFKEEDIPDLIDLKVVVNGTPVEDRSFTFDGKSRGNLSERFGDLFAKKKDKMEPVIIKKHSEELARYHKIHPSKLSKYIGKKVRLQLEAGKRREGKLTKIVGDTLYLTKRMSGGDFSVKVSASRVKVAEVFVVKP